MQRVSQTLLAVVVAVAVGSCAGALAPTAAQQVGPPQGNDNHFLTLDLAGKATVAAPTTAALGHAKIFYDTTKGKLQLSFDTGAWVDLSGGGGSTLQAAYVASSTIVYTVGGGEIQLNDAAGTDPATLIRVVSPDGSPNTIQGSDATNTQHATYLAFQGGNGSQSDGPFNGGFFLLSGGDQAGGPVSEMSSGSGTGSASGENGSSIVLNTGIRGAPGDVQITVASQGALAGNVVILSQNTHLEPYTAGAGICLGGAGQGFDSLYMYATNTATVGAVTINRPAGQAIIAAGASSVVVTDNKLAAGDLIFCTLATNDTTAVLKCAVNNTTSFTISTTANVTANTKVNFLIIKE